MPVRKKPRDIIVLCSGKNHRVRLAGGLRFWSGARCPVCKAPVDPKRTLRLLRWLTNLGFPASRRPLHKILWWGALGFMVLAAAAWIMVWGLGDRWWPATVLLFGPRWVLLLPLIGLLPSAAIKDRALLFPLLLSGFLLVGAVMGFHTGWRSLFAGRGAGDDLTIVSFNAAGGRNLSWSPANLLAVWQPDVAAFQECGRRFAEGLGQIPGWHVDARSGLCLASRFEILGAREMDREALRAAGGAGQVVTYELDLEGSSFLITNLHLDTPRAGFELMTEGRIREGIPKVQEKSFLREIELRQASLWAEGFLGPHIVVGDFNTPVESRSYREAWGEWQNSFSLAGSGFGGTRLNGWIRVRIDHVLANDHWKVLDAWLEEDVGSDHLPTAARLRLRESREEDASRGL